MIVRLVEPSAGEIWLDGRNILELRQAEMRAMRKDAQFIFQDPYSSLNPRMTVSEIVAEPLRNFGTDRGSCLLYTSASASRCWPASAAWPSVSSQASCAGSTAW